MRTTRTNRILPLIALLILTACKEQPRNVPAQEDAGPSPPSTHHRGELKPLSQEWDGFMAVWIDPATGCHYLVTARIGTITPRLTPSGQPFCEDPGK